VAARVTDEERAGIAAWLTPAELALFDAMPVADRPTRSRMGRQRRHFRIA